VEATPANLSALLTGKLPVVIDFWAPWCNPCIGFAPVFEQEANNRKGQVRFAKLDTEANQMLAAQYQIRSIPTIMVFKDGKRVDVINGALPQSQFSAWLTNALAK
jgi:thioredoxin 2